MCSGHSGFPGESLSFLLADVRIPPSCLSMFSPWSLGGNGGMDYGDYYGGLCRDYKSDPSPVPE